MNEFVLWLIVGACLIAFGVALYLLIAIPMKFYQKKEINAYSELAKKFGFEEKLGKAGLKPNFPVIKGFYKKQYFIVKKALSKYRTQSYTPGTDTRTRKWYIQISTKIEDIGISKLSLYNLKTITEGLSVSEFDKYIRLEITPETLKREILTEDIKIEILKLGINCKYFAVELDKRILYSPNMQGLTKPAHVNDASVKIKILELIASRIKSLN